MRQIGHVEQEWMSVTEKRENMKRQKWRERKQRVKKIDILWMLKSVWIQCYTTMLSNLTSVNQLQLHILNTPPNLSSVWRSFIIYAAFRPIQHTKELCSLSHKMNWVSLEVSVKCFFLFSKHCPVSNLLYFLFLLLLNVSPFISSLSSRSGIHPFANSALRVKMMMSPTCEWLWFVQEQHGYQVKRRAGLLCFPSLSPLLSLVLLNSLSNSQNSLLFWGKKL